MCSQGQTNTGEKGVEFLIGWCDFPLDKDDVWEPIAPITNLPGSEHMIDEFNCKIWICKLKVKR